MTSPFLETMSKLLTGDSLAVTRFEFEYMASRRESMSRRPPPKAEKLMPEYVCLLRDIAKERSLGQRLIIGGKSLGGRVASMIADEAYAAGTISGLVCLGYPFHPPGKPDQLRTAHLKELICPALIVQGVRDPFGNIDEAAHYELSPQIAFHWVDDGDHDLAPRRASGSTQSDNLAGAARAVAAFAGRLQPPR